MNRRRRVRRRQQGHQRGRDGGCLDGLGGEGRKLVVILGGDGKGTGLRPLVDPVVRHARAVVLIGATRRRSAQCSSRAPGRSLHGADTLPKRSRLRRRGARRRRRPLSPACASSTCSANYLHRSKCSAEAVRNSPPEVGQHAEAVHRLVPSRRRRREFNPAGSMMAFAGSAPGARVGRAQLAAGRGPGTRRRRARPDHARHGDGVLGVDRARRLARLHVAQTHFVARHVLSLGIAFCARRSRSSADGTWQRLAP